MTDQRQLWIIDQYDQFFLDKTDGSELEKTREHLAHMLLDAVQNGAVEGPKPDMEWALNVTNTSINPLRTQRRQSFKKNAEFLLDWFNNPDEGIHIDPFLDRVYPLGSHDGKDKAFRYWTREDLTASVFERYRNAAAVMEAAKEHDEIVQRWFHILHMSNAAMIQDCYEQVAA